MCIRDRLNDRLAPLVEGERLSDVPASSPVQAQFDLSTWEFFLGQYNAEMESLKKTEVVRFRHLRRAIDQIWNEVKHDVSNPIPDAIKEEFVIWWKGIGEKQKEIDEEVQQLEEPNLEDVKADRLALGLHV